MCNLFTTFVDRVYLTNLAIGLMNTTNISQEVRDEIRTLITN